MTKDITAHFKAKFMSDKLHYDGLSQSIRTATELQLGEKVIKALTVEKQKYKAIFTENCTKMLNRMNLGCNMVELGGNWYATRYLNRKDNRCIKIDLLCPEDTHILVRDERVERALSQEDIDRILPGLIDADALEEYKKDIHAKANEILYAQTGVVVTKDEEGEETDPNEIDATGSVLTVTAHAGLRYVQRVLKLHTNDKQEAEAYRRDHYHELNDLVIDMYGRAEQIWVSEDDYGYYFNDQDNIMFVVSANNNIVTLYEEDFGFTKEINVMIVRKQIEVMREAHKAYMKAREYNEEHQRTTEREVSEINDRIAMLEAEMSELLAERASHGAKRDLTIKQVSMARTNYNSEFNKLFTKFT